MTKARRVLTYFVEAYNLKRSPLYRIPFLGIHLMRKRVQAYLERGER